MNINANIVAKSLAQAQSDDLASIIATFSHWLSASEAIHSSLKVSSITDGGTLGINATQSTGSEQPDLEEDVAEYNNHNLVRFSSGKFFDTAAINFNYSDDWEMWLVGDWDSGTMPLYGQAGLTSYVSAMDNSGKWYFQNGSQKIITAVTCPNPGIWLIYGNSSAIHVYDGENGNTYSVGSVPNAGVIAMNAVGKLSSTTGDWNLAELGWLIGSNQSTSDRNQLGSLLASKYNLTWTDL